MSSFSQNREAQSDGSPNDVKASLPSEIIIVLNGCTDGSAEIANEFARRDSRIRLGTLCR
jgi:glycosyltransferase involved in cell wall biosynthesis